MSLDGLVSDTMSADDLLTNNSPNSDYYNAVGAWFLGPQGENSSALTTLLTSALGHHIDGRLAYFPDDSSPIPPDMKVTDTYKANIKKLQDLVNELGPKLAINSVPFWSPRYNAHMNMDTSMPGIVGYFTAMLSNPNNVAVEASPLTTVIETKVGKDLAELVGFNITVDSTSKEPVGWGHITCGGSIANLESMWAARNLKFYPLSLRLAMKNELIFLADTFTVPLCDGSASKLLKDFDTWELLNITPHNILEIPTRLLEQYGVTAQFLQAAMKPYLAQTLGKEELEKRFEVKKPMRYFASAAMHYSWPKSAAITGIGSANIIPVNVDNSVRMDPNDLRKHLQECLDERIAVYTVVAIIGSTEHGACDPLKDIIDIREEFRQKGLSFVVHADGAWGTYFLTAVPPKVIKAVLTHTRGPLAGRKDNFVPTVPLKPKTIESIAHMRYCDSVTVDPHKSGFVQYPAGGLLYRDQRMRYQVTWTSPIVYRNDAESIGVYGVEGSKPGAAPVAIWFSHFVMGLNESGYGQLLGQAMFSGVRMYSHLATMSTADNSFILRPLNLLPAEETNSGDNAVEEQKKFIRERILPAENRALVDDAEAWKLLLEMGSDLTINAFAVNFKIDGQVNEDIVEANYLNKRIFNALSITRTSEVKPPLVLTSTVLAQKTYGSSLTTLKNRLGLKGDQDLYTLVNVVMSPWPTAIGLTREVAESLQKTIEKETEVSIFRNTLTNDFHAFVIQGTNKLHFVHLPMFNMENHRKQIIMSGSLPEEMMAIYVQARKDDPTMTYLLVNEAPSTLSKMVEDKGFEARIESYPSSGDPVIIARGKISEIQVIVEKKLNSQYLTPYPTRSMPFYMYGSGGQQHIDHVYTASPNIQMTADQVSAPDLCNDNLPLLYAHLPLPESAMQPFPNNFERNTSQHPFFFRAGAKFENVVFSRDLAGKEVITTGPLTLGQDIFVDTDMLNDDPEPKKHEHGHGDSESTSRGLSMPQSHCQIKPMNMPAPEHPFKRYIDTIENIEQRVLSGAL